jgi:tetratricopeptide (TPR) repeat protein
LLQADEISYQDRQEAERLKNEGNDYMKREQYEEALKSYTKAIQLDSSNAAFFCNRYVLTLCSDHPACILISLHLLFVTERPRTAS